ncbi:MAG: hypothetical protein AAF611_03635 [Bacteroidota bacterium]
MKRSRRSEYDKRRNRSKKHSERKFSFTSKSTKSDASSKPKPKSSSKPKASASSTSSTKKATSPAQSSIDRLKSFEINENNQKKYKYREVVPKKRSGCFNFRLPLFAVIIIAIIRLIMSFNDNSSSNPTEDPNIKKISNNDRVLKQKFRRTNAAHLVQGIPWPMRETLQLQKDSLFPIVPNVNVRLFKGFHLYDTSVLKNTAIFAKFAKYYFFYDRVEKSSTTTMSRQWENMRNTLINRMTPSVFSQEEIKNYTFKDIQIEEHDFKILFDSGELHGVATLVEFEDTRYFFHLISKEKPETHFRRTFLRKYLDYYLKIR